MNIPLESPSKEWRLSTDVKTLMHGSEEKTDVLSIRAKYTVFVWLSIPFITFA